MRANDTSTREHRLSRREFFKLGAGTAALGASAGILSTAVRPGTAQANSNIDFSVEIAGIDPTWTVYTAKPVNFRMRRAKAGKPKPIKKFDELFVVSGPADPATEAQLMQWVAANEGGGCDFRDITIRIMDKGAPAPVRTFTYSDCFPVRYSFNDVDTSAPGGGVRQWTLEIRVNRIVIA